MPSYVKAGFESILDTAQSQSLLSWLILNGTYDYPDDFDQATKEILQECALIRLIIPIDSGSTIITLKQWVDHWWQAKEQTLLSISGRHFGHCKVGTRSPSILSYIKALYTTIISNRGIVLD